MSFLKVRFSGNVAARLKQRIIAWTPNKVGAILTVPEHLAWWRYQEFGTASRNEAGDAAQPRYTIKPIGESYNVNNESNPHQLIFWHQGLGKVVNFGSVTHPGVKAAGFVRKALPEIQSQMVGHIRKSLRNKGIDKPAVMQEAVLHSVQRAKDQIVESMATHLGHYSDSDPHPEYGKLKGQKPEDAFFDAATVNKIE